MSEHEALIAAVKAEQAAAFAHERLDRMNGSIDRLTRTVDEKYAGIDAKIDAVLLHQATQLGEAKASTTWLDSKRFVITTMALLFTGLCAFPPITWWLSR